MTLMLCGREHEDRACPLCLSLLATSAEGHDLLDPRMVMPVPKAGPLSTTGERICYDCAAAEGLLRFGKALDFYMARIATGQDRLERLRLPGVRLGWPGSPVSEPGDLDTLYDWQDKWGFNSEHRDAVREDARLEQESKRS